MRTALVLVVVILAAPRTAAQTAAPAVEVGGRTGVFLVAGDDGGVALSLGPVLSLRVLHGLRVELALDALAPSEHSGLFGIYQLAVSQAVRPDGRLVARAGFVGAFRLDPMSERTITRLDGSTVVFAPRTYARLAAPQAALVGIGFRRPVSRRAAIGSDVSLMIGGGVLLHATVGVVVPLGSAYER